MSTIGYRECCTLICNAAGYNRPAYLISFVSVLTARCRYSVTIFSTLTEYDFRLFQPPAITVSVNRFHDIHALLTSDLTTPRNLVTGTSRSSHIDDDRTRTE